MLTSATFGGRGLLCLIVVCLICAFVSVSKINVKLNSRRTFIKFED